MDFEHSEADHRELLREHYGRVLDEYRFQVELNWKRSQYFFVLNLGVLVAATGLLSAREPRAELVGALFVLGLVLCVVTIFANRRQHQYYVATREVKREIETELGLSRLALEATPGMQKQSAGHRPVRVRDALDAVLGLLAVVDLAGAVLVYCWFA